MTQLPALSLAAAPGRRRNMIEVAREAERKGFAGIYAPSLGDGLSLCAAIAMVTNTIHLGTSVTPIYTRNVADFAATAAFIHEISNGRFRLGIGVSHAAAMNPMGITQGKPLSDIRQFVEDLHAVPNVGELPPVVLATLRHKMIALAEDVADGIVFANAVRSHMANSLSVLSDDTRSSDAFYIGNMIPTCINNDKTAAMGTIRRMLTSYALLPNYRNYWKQAGYEEEMHAVEEAIAVNDLDRVSACLSDRWLSDTSLFGSAGEVREGIEAWLDSGVRTPIIVPKSTTGGQLQAIQEFFELWD